MNLKRINSASKSVKASFKSNVLMKRIEAISFVIQANLAFTVTKLTAAKL